jgi:hypothetical protein
VLPEFCMPGAIGPFEPGGLLPVAAPVVESAVGLDSVVVPVPAVLELVPGAVVTPGVVVVVPAPVCAWAAPAASSATIAVADSNDFILVLQSVGRCRAATQ